MVGGQHLNPDMLFILQLRLHIALPGRIEWCDAFKRTENLQINGYLWVQTYHLWLIHKYK